MIKRLIPSLLLAGILLLFNQQDSVLANEPITSKMLYWYEGKKTVKAWLSGNEKAIFTQNQEKRLINDTNYDVVLEKSPIAILRLKSNLNVDYTDSSYPVLYKNNNIDPQRSLILTGKIIVRFNEWVSFNTIKHIEDTYNLKHLEVVPFASKIHIYEAKTKIEAIDTARLLHESGYVTYAYPDTINMAKNHLRYSDETPQDTLFKEQWHLKNTGQDGGTTTEDLNVTPVWQTFRGSTNEVIAVVDDGIDIKHEDLVDNIISELNYDFIDKDEDPTPVNIFDNHGTEVAGVVAARGFNTKGVVGVAPYAGIVGYRLLGVTSDESESNALTRNYNKVDIYTNSWGPSDDGMTLEAPGPLTEDAISEGAKNGRGGLGSIYVWANGNGGSDNDNSNYDGYANSRYTIAVSASTDSGTVADYSEPGANIVVNCPSSGNGHYITTTDISDPAAPPDVAGYTNGFSGTSAAAPQAAGVIALMLEANPNLNWRDVAQVLANTATKLNSSHKGWSTNSVGYPIHYYYGFGRVNAAAAVNSSKTWTTMGQEISTQATSSPNALIPDGTVSGITDSVTIDSSIKIETIEVYFNAPTHKCWGDLDITLVSPTGTESKLAQSHTVNCIRTTYFYVTLIMLAPFLTLGFIIFVFFGFILLIIM
ncbi:MAG: S8 family serine peptidase, partial [Candidatus Magnetoovum sp. WYHC-5]|nr:S8 family serine peptidase [Candidatus Magnetoovum sp. WYHC-5]